MEKNERKLCFSFCFIWFASQSRADETKACYVHNGECKNKELRQRRPKEKKEENQFSAEKESFRWERLHI